MCVLFLKKKKRFAGVFVGGKNTTPGVLTSKTPFSFFSKNKILKR
jgi:hypothetical protein